MALDDKPPLVAGAVPGEASKASILRWSTLALLAIAALIAQVDRVNISAALTTESFKEFFLLSNTERGWISSAFFWSYALLQVPIGWVVDRYGVKTPYAICFALWCLATAALGLVSAFWALIVMRLVVGAAEAVVVPATYRWIRTNFHPNNSGKAVGFYSLGTKFGPAIGAPLAAWLIVSFNWKIMFLVTGLLGLVWLVPWMLMVKNDRPRGEAAAARKKHAETVPFSNILASPVVWGSLVINFCYNYFTFFCMTWMPAYLVERRGLSLNEMGLYTFYSFAGIAFVALAAGWAADSIIGRIGKPILVRKVFIVSGFAVACTVLLGARTQDLDTALFWNVVSLSGLGLATANNLALCSLTLIPPQVVGQVKGLQNVATALAGGSSAYITGKLLDVTGSYTAPMTLIFFFLVLGAATVIVMLRPEWSPKVTESTAVAKAVAQS